MMADGSFEALGMADPKTQPKNSFDVDGGDDGSWLLKPGDRVCDDRSARIGTVVKLTKPMAWDEKRGFLDCNPKDPDAIFTVAQVEWDETQTFSGVKTLHLRMANTDTGTCKFFSAAMLQDKPVPERKWAVEGLIPSGTVTLLGGDGGTGKSLLALQLAVSAASGTSWLDRAATAGPVVYISAEDDDDELHRRLDDVTRAEGLPYPAKLVMRSLAGKDALLASIPATNGPLKPSDLFAEVEYCLGVNQPVLLVLDTLADLFPGNENDRAQARQFIGMLRGLAIEHECAVVLLSHPSLSGMNSGTGTSGSTGWNNSVRSRLYLERVTQDGYEANPDARVLKTMKANYGRIGGEIGMTWRNGVFVADAPETGLDRMATGMKAERVFLKLLRLLTEQGLRVNANNGPSSAPATFAAHPGSEGVRKPAFKTAMAVLLGKGVVKIAEEGPPSRRVSYLFEVI